MHPAQRLADRQAQTRCSARRQRRAAQWTGSG